MQVTCVTISQAERLPLLAYAMQDFLSQTYANRDLLIVHDSDDATHLTRQRMADSMSRTFKDPKLIQVHQCPSGMPLGTLRNLASSLCRGTIICQWDDDDRYHPLRLELQLEALREQGAAFSFLSDQLHYFSTDKVLSWDDWNIDPYPLNFIPGTLMGMRDEMPQYPNVSRGEDTSLCLSVIAQGKRIVRLRGCGWCYVYVFHGANVWSDRRHRSISAVKGLTEARLRSRQHDLSMRLEEYTPQLRPTTLIHRSGALAWC